VSTQLKKLIERFKKNLNLTLLIDMLIFLV
jgi:hypothetical protein